MTDKRARLPLYRQMTMTRTKVIQRPAAPVLHHNIPHLAVRAHRNMMTCHSDVRPHPNLYDVHITWASSQYRYPHCTVLCVAKAS